MLQLAILLRAARGSLDHGAGAHDEQGDGKIDEVFETHPSAVLKRGLWFYEPSFGLAIMARLRSLICAIFAASYHVEV